MDLKDKEIEWIERIVSTDRRFLDNREWLEEMDEDHKVGHPAVVWTEAMMLADIVQSVEQGRDNVFARWGIGMKEKELYAVRMMAIYILEHPTEYRTNTNFDELGRIKAFVMHDDYDRMKVECSGMVAECLVIDYIKRKALKRIIKELIDITSPLGITFLTAVLTLVVTFNRDLNGALDNEQNKVLDLINKKREEMNIVKRQIEEGKSIFSEEQIEHSGIVKDKRLWLEMMYGMVNGDYRLKSNIEMSDEDLCVGFLVVLKANSEYDDKGGYDSFFRMMSELMNIEMSEKKKSRIIRYIQDNKVDFYNWKGESGKRYIRKKIAQDLMTRFTEKKRKLGLSK
ncbi:MAG: hypothetical protein MR923_11935 [Prevotella sp.]|nr:hypothetical protein [Prevotella sp.]